MTFTGPFAGHELDDALPVFATAFRAELILKDRQHGTVELLRLCHAHLMNLEANNREARARKYFDHPAWTQVWEAEIVRLNEHKCFFDLSAGGVGDRAIEDPTIGIRKFGPQF